MGHKLEKIIGYSFSDPTLLRVALTHRSFHADNYERFEFLGDSILNLVITGALFKQFPTATEGELTRLRASLIKEETLCTLAQQFALGDHILLGSGELKSGGRRRHSILADVCESIIGAIYLDSDFTICRNLVLTWYEALLSELTMDTLHKDSKTTLQEYLQARQLALPTYQIIQSSGSVQEPVFTVCCEVSDLKVKTKGKGSNRRKAEQVAAEIALQQIRVQCHVKQS